MSRKRDLPDRTEAFALAIVRLCQMLEGVGGVGRTLGWQLIRSGTSIGANVAEGEGAQSEADFLSKYSIAAKESHETGYWLKLLKKADILPPEQFDALIKECSELTAILTTICKKLKTKKQQL